MKSSFSRMRQSNGFSLLELIVAMAIATMVLGWALPVYRKLTWQGEVDRYAQMIESGLFSLRSNLGVHRSNCCINFRARSSAYNGLGVNDFGDPIELLEFFDSDSSSSLVFTDDTDQDCNGHRLQCLPDDAHTEGYRFISRENSRESKAVEVASLTASYVLSPPGTSTSGDDLTILVRSKHQKHSDGLRVRCVLLTGNGDLNQGSWNRVGSTRREICPHDPDGADANAFWDTSKCFCEAEF